VTVDPQDDEEAGDRRRTASLAALALILLLAILATVLVRELASVSALQDCLFQGRLNCAPIE
jgi:hypothetical protein